MDSQDSQEKTGGNTKTPVFKQSNYQAWRWIITLPDRELLTASQISQHLKGFCNKFTFQKEKGEKTDYFHWQIEITLKEKTVLSTLKNLIGWHDAHIEKTKDYFAARNYCTKEDTRVEGPYNEKSTFLKVPSIHHQWQIDIEDMLHTEPDTRKVFWLWEPIGGIGKTTLCRYLLLKYKKKINIFPSGKSADVAFAITEETKMVIFDLPRTMEDHFNYNILEQIKNGLIWSPKYESNMKIIDIPHVIIFANWEPNTSALSQDRWVIRRLTA